MKTKLIFLAALAALLIVGIKLNKVANNEPEPPPPPDPGRIVTIDTNRGQIKFVLYEKDMPVTTRNFADLANSGFYKGLKFHRVEDIVIQGGDPKGDGTGGSKKTIKLEISPRLGFGVPYMVGMARKPQPDSATSQFFVNKQPYEDWTNKYAAFGRVFEGTAVVDHIQKGDVMRSVTVSKPTDDDLAAIDKMEGKVPWYLRWLK